MKKESKRLIQESDFNYPALAKRIKTKNTWEANAKKKLQAEQT